MTLLGICVFGCALIASIIFAIFANRDEDFKGCFWDKLALTIVIGIGGALSGLLISMVITACVNADIATYEKSEEIVLLKDNSNIDGSFRGGLFFSSGVIGEEMVYVMYVKTATGFDMKKVKCSDATVVYTKTTPRIVTTWEDFADTKRNKFLGAGNCYVAGDLAGPKYIIEVPDTTITNAFKLDGE